MLFNSYEFICVFLPVVLIIYFLLARFRYTKVATAFLVLASLAFYAYWDKRYVLLLVFSIVFNYKMGSYIELYRKKSLLVFGIAVNFVLLGYYKYTGFFLSSLNDVFHSGFLVPTIVLPLGISFFTFTQTAYLIDAYRGETKKYSFLSYSLFVTIFPHLIAGPIIYHKDMIPQFSRLKNFIFNYNNFALGCTFFIIGLYKKTIIADSISPWVQAAFANCQGLSFLEAWVGAIGYTLQLYFDFSGYSEMAIGLGLLFNFKLPVNFHSPYQACSMIELWRRWHITLSVYLKNYLYIPLGGSRYGRVRQMINVFVTFLLGGIWHGAGWTYVLWGALHGAFLVINHMWRRVGKPLPDTLAWCLTFLSWVVTLVVFRASSVADALAMIKTMFNFGTIFSAGSYGVQLGQLRFGGNEALVLLAVLMVVVRYSKSVPELLDGFQPNLKWAVGIAILFVMSLITLSGRVSEFLYFQF